MGKKYTSPEPLTLAHVGGDFMALVGPRGLKATVFETGAPWLGTDGGFRRIGGHGALERAENYGLTLKQRTCVVPCVREPIKGVEGR